jgi:hypothetical protein
MAHLPPQLPSSSSPVDFDDFHRRSLLKSHGFYTNQPPQSSQF